jgi:hypothetical protein
MLHVSFLGFWSFRLRCEIFVYVYLYTLISSWVSWYSLSSQSFVWSRANLRDILLVNRQLPHQSALNSSKERPVGADATVGKMSVRHNDTGRTDTNTHMQKFIKQLIILSAWRLWLQVGILIWNSKHFDSINLHGLTKRSINLCTVFVLIKLRILPSLRLLGLFSWHSILGFQNFG